MQENIEGHSEWVTINNRAKEEFMKTYLKVTCLNLLMVAFGAFIWSVAARGLSTPQSHASAITRGTASAASQTAKAAPEKNLPACDSAKFECVSPGMTIGAAGFGTVLAHKVGCDQLQVNGYNMLKLDSEILDALVKKGIMSLPEAQHIIDASKEAKPLRMELRQNR